ncbi:jg13793 [Pararge aegeria aegeria]|uniref:Jg13793 protein n=1 Tax=Pararge aegeria aegeria TaxID=348720 RepID=A0A8S4S933_9NEOP|nr:jg13793 [Pararge aegeria aegeria]
MDFRKVTPAPPSYTTAIKQYWRWRDSVPYMPSHFHSRDGPWLQVALRRQQAQEENEARELNMLYAGQPSTAPHFPEMPDDQPRAKAQRQEQVSTRKGTKMKLLSRFSYLRLLACSALVAAAPTIDEVAWMQLGYQHKLHPTEVTFQATATKV